MIARAATLDDVEELLRLRAVLLRAFHRGPWDDDWRDPARQLLASKLTGPSPTIGAFVVLSWFEAQGVPRITLMATKDGEPLYESLGFTRTADPAMRVSRSSS